MQDPSDYCSMVPHSLLFSKANKSIAAWRLSTIMVPLYYLVGPKMTYNNMNVQAAYYSNIIEPVVITIYYLSVTLRFCLATTKLSTLHISETSHIHTSIFCCDSFEHLFTIYSLRFILTAALDNLSIRLAISTFFAAHSCASAVPSRIISPSSYLASSSRTRMTPSALLATDLT